MAKDELRYDRMIEDALRGVVRDILVRTAESGLPGNHHFYITFATGHDSVSMPDRLRARYRDEMTIVLQHQYWDLEVGEDSFAVSLSFDRAQQRLDIPFDAITTFADPSVQFGLQFQARNASTEAAAETVEDIGAVEDGLRGQMQDGAGEVIALDSFRKKSS